MKKQSAGSYHKDIQAHAQKMLSEHQLLGEAYWEDGKGARWLIGKPGTNIHRCEIIAGILGSLVVHGDFETARFAHHEHSNAWRRLLWMGDHKMDSYVREKASIGSGARVVDDYDAGVATYELEQLITEYTAEDEPNEPLIEVLRGALKHTEYQHELREYLSDKDEGWDLWEHRIGEVTQGHVIVSHTALVKCAELLRAKHGDAGPPECRTPVIDIR